MAELPPIMGVMAMPARDWSTMCKVRRGRWFTCTLPSRHEGPHVAHCPDNTVARTWQDGDRPPYGLIGWARG